MITHCEHCSERLDTLKDKHIIFPGHGDDWIYFCNDYCSDRFFLCQDLEVYEE